jgi:hypothetical protein
MHTVPAGSSRIAPFGDERNKRETRNGLPYNSKPEWPKYSNALSGQEFL